MPKHKKDRRHCPSPERKKSYVKFDYTGCRQLEMVELDQNKTRKLSRHKVRNDRLSTDHGQYSHSTSDFVVSSEFRTSNTIVPQSTAVSEHRTDMSGLEDCATDMESDGAPDYDFDFAKHKYELSKIFFRDKDFIRIGSKQYADFWCFLIKYRAFQKKQSRAETGNSPSENKSALGLPKKYDKRYRINLSVNAREIEDFLRKGRLADLETDKELTISRVKEFRNILLHYLDFLQKQKFSKLKKLKQDQENLPIYQYRQKIVDMIQNHKVVVVAGDTGCGKSTQVPQYLMRAGFTNIACTQPRRIACISLSKRVAHETLNQYGSSVAYQVRFEKTKTKSTKILFLTEGLLLRQMSADRHLQQYSVIVIDEVHERHIHTDFLLGVIKCLLREREDLKLVLMSATININLFSSYFDDAPVVKVPGRLYPIQLEYCPVKQDKDMVKGGKIDPSPYLRIMQRIDTKYSKSERGDLLVFLSGVAEIMTVVEAAKLYAQTTKTWIVLPLHSALSVEEQDKVFDISPEGVKKFIVSTNIAETSITIDGVRFIVDSGKVKEMSYDPKYKMRKLEEFWISRASAEQRKGRAGRTGPGVCFRLYDESDYDAFQEYATPEIQRVPLDSLILQMMSMGLPDARKFPFLEAPSMSSIEDSVLFLKDQSALTEDEHLTPIGQMLSRLPVDVVIGKMLIMGSIFHMVDPVLSIAAAMSVQSPFTSRAYTDHDAMAARKPLESDHGDPFTLLNVFDEWIKVKADGRGTRKWCKRRALEEQRFYEMTKLKNQFRDLLRDHHLLDGIAEKQKYHTSDERRKKHGERKKLGQLKKVMDKESRKRKVLKLEDDDFAVSDGEDDDQGSDIKDMEFRLTHDLSQLQEVANRSRNFTLRDVNLLKIILCSGLYPQVAIADDCNCYKRDSEQAFHTKSKPFLLLHPTSVFTAQPELLQLKDLDVEKNVGSDLRGRLSRKHELLSYVTLLETNKAYIVNTMRVPALQTVLLFSNAIDTNSDCTRLVCDGWLEITFSNVDSADQVMSSVIQLRATRQNLIQLRLKDTLHSIEADSRISPRARQLERLLATKLTEFLDSDVCYTVRRILPAETQFLYMGPERTLKDPVSGEGSQCFETSGEVHPVKGGTQVNEYLTFNCLLDSVSASVWEDYTPHMQRHWTCPRCDVKLVGTVLERLQHESECQSQNIEVSKAEEEKEMDDERNKQLNPLRKSYICADCDKQYMFTTTEILKHKRSHSVS